METKRPVLSGRILCAVCAAYTLGIAVHALFSPSVAVIFAAVILFIIATVFQKLPYLFIVIITCSAFLGGIFQFRLLQSKNDAFTDRYTGRYVTVIGQIKSISHSQEERQNIILAADSISALGKTEIRDFSVSLYTDYGRNFSVGDRITFSQILSPVKKAGTHAFDYQLYLHTKNISATFFVSSEKISVTQGIPTLSNKIKSFSAGLANQIRNTVAGDEGEVAAAIALGDKSGFSDDLTDLFTRSGISHVVAVSGMHLSILTAFFFLIAGKTRMHYKIRNIFGIFLVILYMATTGFSPSIVRAGIMLICSLIAAITDRKEDIATSFFLSASLILILNPYTIYSASFLLSYSSLAGILIFTRPLVNKLPHFIPKKINLVIAATLSSSITTFPVLAYMFNGISVLSVLTNILVVPLVTFIFISVFLAAGISFIHFPSGVIFGYIPKLMIKFVLLAARAVSSVTYSYINVKTPTLTTLICYAVIVTLFYLVITDRKPGKAGTLAFSAVLTTAAISISVSALTCSVTFFDVGQGDCALIRTPGYHSYLVDTGATGNTTLSALKSVGLNRLDAIFISHSDKDHSGALEEILIHIPTRKVILPRYDVTGEKLTELARIATTAGADVEFADSYCSYNLAGIYADAVWPSRNIIPYDENSGSLVLRMNIKGNIFLFTGDIDATTESAIIKTRGIVDADVLKVSHHGSSDSTTDEFLKKVTADYSVISSGKNNQYGHPHEDTLLRLESSGSKILRTDEYGDIKFTIDLLGNMRVKYETS